MQKLVDKELIRDLSIELGISPAFIEKDFYAVCVLKELAQLNKSDFKLIFTGGTCLSKGYNLIKRFSEDIDFRIHTNLSTTRNDRKNIRNTILENFKNLQEVKLIDDSMKSQNESNFFSFDLQYPREFSDSYNLRPHLKLEFTFENTFLPFNQRPICSILDQYSKNSTVFEIECLSPIEIGANKFSALIWRVNTRDRSFTLGETKNDPTMIRHLHDLAALEKFLLEADFKRLAFLSFESDKGRGGADKTKSLVELAEFTLVNLENQKQYKVEYNDFVNSLSYAPDSEMISYEKALVAFKRLVEAIRTPL